MDFHVDVNSLDSSKLYWLNNVGNLVAGLTQFYGKIHLNKISQQTLDTSSFEKDLLKVDSALVRQITLSNDNKTIVFARTVIPKSTYNFFAQELDNLGNKPIGDALLYKKDFERSQFIIRELPKQVFKNETSLTSDQNVYSRSSIFSYTPSNNLKVLITEYFLCLPEFTKC
ncbi:chorismate lyase [Allofrancisella guangzhouensis]|uniref:Chorismate--pyruvate lyase n=1 Tax=Allofrancisella guangzhouensis TaxID=594679 RepID=A0A0A8E3J7_9GAMM|nr:chorismate lyase [Allofrancisella guangzhouensis]AJC48182.1 chorismate--pyruvate lyase [Allofrancisella guangzhouensis]MBK2027048.1 chorismate lyase [Allofrancisella guangzhouensis]MBK2044538.1 chorismate lyase [Allofrancisella guangzhouensis]MBK2046130.1 chorismate lyase [Allofrancisella guangzhouensis]